ncbi:MAG: aminotransferase DegT, partial [Anaerolineae bacterium]|nr:aminotransferase DegT [Anaerolineae bacterium]
MIKPSPITPNDLGDDVRKIIPGKDPELSISLPRIPVLETDITSKIVPVCEPTLNGNEKKYVND